MARARKQHTVRHHEQRGPGGDAPAGGDDDFTNFQHPLASRYASPEMSRLWSPRVRHETWRRVWIALAEAQREMGLPISAAQIRELKAAAAQIDFAAAARYEKQTRHDVMAHIHAFGDAAPGARGILHLGATSMDVVDNADLLITRAALDLSIQRLAAAGNVLADFCERYADLPALGFTHLQPAQLTTVGKRAALWLQDLMMDLERWQAARDGIKCRGLRGATGTQAAFVKLLGGAAKADKLERLFARKLGFRECYPVCGQTYSRKIDADLIHTLASFAAGTHKICNDLRLLALRKEIEEPFESSQVGSSAMPYKRNPMRCERATGLARYVISLESSPLMTHAAQMLERTLDDSSNKRIVFPEAFLATDALLILLHNIFDGLVVYPATIAAHIAAELPFIASEEILMEAVARGGDRQELHERIRRHAQQAGAQVKSKGLPNDLIRRLREDPAFAGIHWERLTDPRRYVGAAPRQTREYLLKHARPLLRRCKAARPVELRV